jgi:hypothetical protein
LNIIVSFLLVGKLDMVVLVFNLHELIQKISALQVNLLIDDN